MKIIVKWNKNTSNNIIIVRGRSLKKKKKNIYIYQGISSVLRGDLVKKKMLMSLKYNNNNNTNNNEEHLIKIILYIRYH